MKRVYTLNEREFRRLVNSEVRRLVESGRSRSWLLEDADPTKIDDNRFPLTLSAVDLEKAKKLVVGGGEDGDENDDVVKVEENVDLGPCSGLMPSQTSMNLPKGMLFALTMINGSMPGSGGPGGSLDAFVSKDNYIMDGHHRWIATYMVDPDASLKGHRVNLPGKKLVAVLNAITKGLHGIEAGNPATGGFDQFKNSDALKNDLKAKFKAGTVIKGTIEDAKPKFKTWAGVDTDNDDELIDAMVEKFMENLSGLDTKKIMPGAPGREDMPVIDKDRTPGAIPSTIAALSKGNVDLNPPYAKESASREGRFMVERWQRLAGIIKG